MSTTVLDRISNNQKIQEGNPILVNDENTANIDATFVMVYKALLRTLEKNNFSQEEIKYASKLLTEVYLERRAKAFIDSKIDHMTKMSNHLIDYVLKPQNEEIPLNCYYYNKTKHSMKHEW